MSYHIVTRAVLEFYLFNSLDYFIKLLENHFIIVRSYLKFAIVQREINFGFVFF